MSLPILTNIDLALNELQNSRIQRLASAPDAAEARIYFDTTLHKLGIYNGTGWDYVGGGLDGENGAYYLARENHTGVQAASTISDFNTEVDARIQLIVDSAPSALDTLHELANALGNDENFAATVNTALGLRTQKYSTDVGDNSATSFVLTHNLNTRDVVVTLRQAGSPYALVWADVEMTTVNTVTVRFSVAPTTGQYRVTIVG
jgi:hypothetical protein